MALSAEVGSEQWFWYTGGMQSVTIPADGIYWLGAMGAGGGANGGLGGYSTGYKILRKGQIIYIGVGQAGGGANDYGNRFNGGRDASNSANPAHWSGKHPGGGCTHMATANGELATLSGNTGAVLIVGGGAGAGATNSDIHGVGTGGNGGGNSGGNAQYTGWNYGGFDLAGYGGDNGAGRTAGFGVGQACTNVGAGTNLDTRTGGGAGWAGGFAGTRGGGGGTGYVGGVPSFVYGGVTYAPVSVTGGAAQFDYTSSSNGFGYIKFQAKLNLPVIFNGTTLEKIVFNGTEVKSLIFNGTKLF